MELFIGTSFPTQMDEPVISLRKTGGDVFAAQLTQDSFELTKSPVGL